MYEIFSSDCLRLTHALYSSINGRNRNIDQGVKGLEGESTFAVDVGFGVAFLLSLAIIYFGT